MLGMAMQIHTKDEQVRNEITSRFVANGRKVHYRRSKMEVFFDVLDVVADGSYLPTHIMYKSNVSWDMLQETLGSLKSKGLLVEVMEDSRRGYRLTDKGFRVLNAFRGLKEEANIGSDPLDDVR